ncbi:helix-turn-helix transcriptional regulator [Saccharopolyspora cebuensis]|uniref:Helix-turn-helix domain-containing protein n=1 Tax=Saccharopolyspora cebuensis TaxID=418759 RepID=A0ABV4CPK5_9PSEU
MPETPRARALAKELRAARKAAGLTLRQLGDLLGWSEAKISRVENAHRGIKEDAVAAMLDALGVEGDPRERMLKLAREIRAPAWWELGRTLPHQLVALVDAEKRATRITSLSLNVVPGLLQTRNYTREIMEAAGVDPDEIEDRVSIRQVRQGVLSQRRPVELCSFVDEAVLNRPLGGPRVMVEQLRHVLVASEVGNVVVRLLPLSAGAHAGLSGNFVLFEFVQSRPTVYVEARSSGAFIDAPDDVRIFHEAVERLHSQALDPAASREIMQSYLARYEEEAA